MKAFEVESSSGTRFCPLCSGWSGKIKYTVDHFRIVSCKRCGFVYLQNPLSETADPETYEQYYYDAEILDSNTENTAVLDNDPWIVFNQRINTIKRIRPAGNLLEIGCGRGYFLSLAQKTGYKVQGIELSPHAARYAQEKYNIDVLTGDIEKMALPEEKYDIITMWHVLEHFYNPLVVLKKVSDMLKQDGLLLIEVPNFNSIKFNLANNGNRWVGGNHPRFHLSFFTSQSLAQMLMHSGFTEIKPLFIDYIADRLTIKGLIKKSLFALKSDSFLTVLVRK